MRNWTMLMATFLTIVSGVEAQAQLGTIDTLLEVPFMASSPTADGMFSAGEYSSSMFFSFGDGENPGNPYPFLNRMCSVDCSLDSIPVDNDDDDLSATMHLGYTGTHLFLGFEITDQFINENSSQPSDNDGVQLYIDADADGNDGRNWSREGFELAVDVLGNMSNNRGGLVDGPNSILPADGPDPLEGFYYAAAAKTDIGYNIEYQIPLASMDTFDADMSDGTPDDETVAAAPGDVLRMNFAINDIDIETGGQNEGTHAMAWVVEDNPASPWGGAEANWTVGLELVDGEGGGTTGDYNGNGELDAGDLDIQAQYMLDGNLDGDLDSDGDTDIDDRNLWIETLQKSYVGDANFDGEFGSSDLVSTFIAGKYESGESAGYAEGDFNGDMQFSSADFVAAFIGGGYEAGPRPVAAAVPEPVGPLLLLLGAMGVISRLRPLHR